MLEVSDVAGHDGQSVDYGDGGDHGILQQRVRFAVHEPGPFSEGGGVH